MKRYIEEIFGVCAKVEEWNGKSGLPLFMRNNWEYFVLSIENKKSLLMKKKSDDFNVNNIEKQMQLSEGHAKMSVILWLDAISTYQRNALIRNRISFIVPNSQIYIPEYGMCLKEFSAGKKKKVEKLTAMAQYVLLYFIYQKEWQERSQAKLAEELNISAMNISRAIQELQELKLIQSEKYGKSKMIKSVARGKELYKIAEKYLQSPVQKKIYVDIRFKKDLPLAGEAALASKSMLNVPRHPIYALDKKYTKDISKDILVEPELMANDDYIEIELWKYNPLAYASDRIVDIVSLSVSLRDIEDERIELQIEELMEDYKW